MSPVPVVSLPPVKLVLELVPRSVMPSVLRSESWLVMQSVLPFELQSAVQSVPVLLPQSVPSVRRSEPWLEQQSVEHSALELEVQLVL